MAPANHKVPWVASALRRARGSTIVAPVFYELLSQWGYPAIALATFVEGEVVLLSAGALVHTGALSLPLVILAATVGSFAWGQSWFYTGKICGRALVERRHSWRARAASMQPWLERYGDLSVVVFRFVAGMAVVAPVLIGAGGYPPKRFLALDAIGALIWASVFGGAGFVLGSGLGKVLGRRVDWFELVGIALLGALVIALTSQVVRARIARRTGSGPHQTTT